MAKLSKHDDYMVKLLGWYESTEAVFIAMEYLKLGDLQSYIADKIPEFKVKTIVVRLLEGLRITLANGFTHRDLKLQNVFVDVWSLGYVCHHILTQQFSIPPFKTLWFLILGQVKVAHRDNEQQCHQR